MQPDQLPHLETFAEAAEHSSFTAAARALGLTQAAISQRISALEKAAGVALFQRKAGHVLLSDAGQRLYPFAQRILALHQEALQKVAGRKAPLAGELSLAASSIPGEHLLPRLLSAFHKKHHHVQVRVQIADTKAVLEQVEQGKVNLGLVGGKGTSPHLEYRCFACDTLVLIVPARHALARRRQITLADLCRQPLIVREPGSGSRWCLEHALAGAKKSPRDLRIALELGSNEAIKEAVQRGLGLAVLSRHAVHKEIKAGTLRALTVSGLALEREMFVVWDRRRVLPIPAKLFLDLLEPCRKQGRKERTQSSKIS